MHSLCIQIRLHCLRALMVFFVLGVASFPPPIQAHITSTNWNFSSNADGWTMTNGQGTNTCNNNGSSSESTLFGSLGYNNNLSGRTALHGQGGALILTTTANRAMAHQTFTMPGSGSIRVFGRFRYYANSNGWSGANTSWVRMDVYDATNSTWITNFGCASFNSNQSWTHISPISSVLTGGTTYTIRLTMRIQSSGGLSLVAVTHIGLDDIEINVAPTGINVSQSPGESPEVTWNTSTPASGAPSLHASESYEIARHTSSPVSASHIIGTTVSTSYTDAGVAGNTQYWYAIFDKDINGTRSPPSAEVSILTRPSAPQNLDVESTTEDSAEITWEAPTNGATSYRIQRAPDVSGSPGSYSTLATGHTSLSFTDSTINCSHTYWYRVAGENASGVGAYTPPVPATTDYCISITLDSDGVVNFGVQPKNTARSTAISELNDAQTITPADGPVDLSIKTTVFTHDEHAWSLGNSPGNNTVKWEYSDTGNTWHTFNTPDSYASFAQNVSDSIPVFFRLSTPTASESFGPYSAAVTILATRP